MMTNGTSIRTIRIKEEEMAFFEELQSPTDSSEDSVEVKISPISSRNKRKCAEPRKVADFEGPLKKRMCLKMRAEAETPFRPWSPKPLDLKVQQQQEQHAPEVVEAEQSTFDDDNIHEQQSQRNYKNMTRERRIEANARERTRVHTISAAFDTLRKSIPSYSHNQKLSKLSVLRIACSYIMTLSHIVSGDESGTAEGVEMVTKTIQREGKLRKKKDDND